VTSESSSPKDCDFGVSASSCRVQQVLIKESYWGTNTLSPNLKVGGPVSPGPCGCCAYGCCYGDTLNTDIVLRGVKLDEISPNPRIRHILTDIPLTCWILDQWILCSNTDIESAGRENKTLYYLWYFNKIRCKYNFI